eukprot:SAG22_NODE_8100_length_683_cov_0.955479_1_plen_118_part_10
MITEPGCAERHDCAAQPAGASEPWRDPAAFEAAVRAEAAGHRGLCVLDVSLGQYVDFEYGRFALIARDLASSPLPAPIAAAVQQLCAAHGVEAAFRVRVELVNYNKVMLHLCNESTLA